MALKKRIIGLPQTTATTNSGSPIAGGTSSMLPTDTATVKLPKPATPASVTNPSSLTPGTTVKSFSDNMTKPIGVGEVKQPVTPKPAQTQQGNPIGQNVDGSYIYEQSKPAQTPTTPATTPTGTTGTPVTGTPTTGITPPQPEFSGSLYDANNYLGSGKTKDEFTAMGIDDQTNLINQAVQNVEERQAILNQVKTYAENKAQQEYQAKQNAIRTGIDQSQTTSAEIQASQRIREAQTNLDNMKQNLGFLGTGGRPMKSATAIEGASRMLMQSEQTFQELKNLEAQAKTMREAGLQMNANQYEEQMRQLQKQLTDSVDASIIQAMQGFDSEAALASIDSPKKLFDLQQKYLDMVDTSVEGITNRQVNEMKNLQTRYADYAKQFAEDLKQRQTQQAEFTKNKNTLNENMSKAVGYYVDGNGSPLQTTDGKVIEYKDEADKPIIDWSTGKVAYFNTDANGNQVVEIKQLFTPEQKAPNIEKVGVGADGKDIYGYYDSATGQVKTLGTNTSTGSNTQVSDPTVQSSIAQYSQQQRGRATLQCGELVNDYIKKETGFKGSLGNSFADKVAGIEKIGRSPSPVVGGVFAFDIKTSQGNTGHTGIVTGINPDGSITVLEANRKENSANGGVPTQGTYTPAQVSNMVFSQAPTNNNLTMQAQALVSGIGGTKEERADLVNNIVKIAQSEGISVQEAKAKLGLRSKTDDDFINVRTKDRDKTQEAGKALTQVKGAIQALNNPNPTTDLIGIVGLLKSIDPTSVARSDEVQNVKKAAGVLEAAQTQLKSWKSGDLLSPKQRVQLQEAMQTIVDAYDRKTATDRNQIIKDFDKRGIDPNIIFGTNEIEGSRSGIANELALQAGGANQSAQQTTGTLSGGTNRLKK